MGVNIHTHSIDSIVINIWDCAGQEIFSGLKSSYYTGAHAGIVMFDVTSKLSFKNALKWYTKLRKHIDGPIVLCGNKVDINTGRKIFKTDISNMKYYDISVKSCYNINKPFKYIIRKLTTPQKTPPSNIENNYFIVHGC